MSKREEAEEKRQKRRARREERREEENRKEEIKSRYGILYVHMIKVWAYICKYQCSMAVLVNTMLCLNNRCLHIFCTLVNHPKLSRATRAKPVTNGIRGLA